MREPNLVSSRFDGFRHGGRLPPVRPHRQIVHDAQRSYGRDVPCAATNDSGSPGGWPAFSPNVVAVGGTTLTVDATGNYPGRSPLELQPAGEHLEALHVEAQPAIKRASLRKARRNEQFPMSPLMPTPSAACRSTTRPISAHARRGIHSAARTWLLPCWAGIIATLTNSAPAPG